MFFYLDREHLNKLDKRVHLNIGHLVGISLDESYYLRNDKFS